MRLKEMVMGWKIHPILRDSDPIDVLSAMLAGLLLVK
jgi:hypothetical protein